MTPPQRRRSARPDLPGEAEARMASLPKPQYRTVIVHEPIDTRLLMIRKSHPDREPRFLDYLRGLPCEIAGIGGHACWNVDFSSRNRAAHCRKAISGRRKRTDREAITLCDFAHDEQERDMNAFDRKYGINRFALADQRWAEYCAKEGRNPNG
jgi:hypothetical protein